MNQKPKKKRWIGLFYVSYFQSPWLNALANVSRFGAFYLLVCALLWYFEPQLLFPRWSINNYDPVQVQENWKSFHIEDEVAGKIHGVLFVPNAYSSWRQAKGTVVYFHGNAETVDSSATWVPNFCDQHDVNVLVFDYPDYGKSTGSPSEKTLLQSGRVAINWWKELSGKSPSELVFLGKSIGGGVAVPLAIEYEPRALVLERTFDTAVSPASNRYWFIPVRWLMTNTFRSIDHAPHYNGPVLQSHGEVDSIIPMKFGRKLYEAFPNKTEFVQMVGIGHNERDSFRYRSKLKKFLESVF